MKTKSILSSILMFTVIASLTMGCGKKDKKDGKGGKGGKASSGKKWGKADWARLMKIEVPGFKLLPNNAKPIMNATAYYEGKKKANNYLPFVWAIFNPCFGGCKGKKMGDMAAWNKLKPNLNMMMSAAVKKAPGLVNELKEMDFDGTKVMTLYTKAFVKSGKSTVSNHGLDVYFNNGKNELILKVSARSKPYQSVKSADDLEKALSKKEMVDAAKAMFKHLKKEL